MKRRLGSGRISPPAGFEPATPWSEVGSANRSATRTLQGYWIIVGYFRSCKGWWEIKSLGCCRKIGDNCKFAFRDMGNKSPPYKLQRQTETLVWENFSEQFRTLINHYKRIVYTEGCVLKVRNVGLFHKENEKKNDLYRYKSIYWCLLLK